MGVERSRLALRHIKCCVIMELQLIHTISITYPFIEMHLYSTKILSLYVVNAIVCLKRDNFWFRGTTCNTCNMMSILYQFIRTNKMAHYQIDNQNIIKYNNKYMKAHKIHILTKLMLFCPGSPEQYIFTAIQYLKSFRSSTTSLSMQFNNRI